MDSATRYETTCPNCGGTFDVDAQAAEGECPFCRAHLRFLEEAPPPPPEAPSLGPAPDDGAPPQPGWASPPPEAVGAMPEPEHDAQPPVHVAAPGPGEVQIECPSCAARFNVASDTPTATCGACGSRLRLENKYAQTAPGALPTSCPACSHPFEVAPHATRGSCPSCGAHVRFEDEFPGDEAPPLEPHAAPPRAAPEAQPEPPEPTPVPPPPSPLPPTPEPVPEPEPEPDDEAPLDAAPARRRGLFRRFREPDAPPPPPAPEAPARQEPPPAAAAPSPPPRKRRNLVRGEPEPSQEAVHASSREAHAAPPTGPARVEVPAEGLSYEVSCPTCQKEFAVTPREKEGNCPHCKAPLAFLGEREYRSLLEAEDRKKALQAKLAERRARRKGREDARLARLEARRESRLQREGAAGAPGVVAPSSLKQRLLRPFRTRRGRAAVPAPAAALESPPAGTVATEPAPPPKAGPKRAKWLKRNEPVPVEPAAPASLDVEAVTVDAAPAEATPPATSDVAKERGIGAFFRRFFRRKPKAAAPPTVEVFPIEFAEASIDLAPSPTPAPPARGRKSRKASPAPGPNAVSVDVAPPSDAPAAQPQAAPKKGLFSRLLKQRADSAPSASTEIATATIELAEVSLDGPTASGVAHPPAKPKKGKAGAPAGAAPASVEIAGVDLGSAEEVAAAPPSPAPPKKGFLGRFRRSKPTPEAGAPPAPVEVSMDLGGAEPVASEEPKKGRRGKGGGRTASVEATIEL